MSEKKTKREYAKELEGTMRCYCDLDKWQPERDTRHSWVCPIHKAAVAAHKKDQG